MSESERIVSLIEIQRLLSNVVSKIIYISTRSTPAYLLVDRFLFRVIRNFHSIIEQTIWLRLYKSVVITWNDLRS